MNGATLTSRQQQQVLETIAQRMVIVNRVLMILRTEQLDEFAAETLLDAAQFMAETVGAMADDATGGDVLGSMDVWLYGQTFPDLSDRGGLK